MNATTTPAPRQRKPRQKPERKIRLITTPTALQPGIVRITVGAESTDYFLFTLTVDFGRGFRLEKIGTEGDDHYHVNLDGEKKTCECKGHLRHGHCKHGDGLAALISSGKLI